MWDYFGRRGSRKGSKSTSSATEAGAQDSSSATTATGAGVKSAPPAHSLPQVTRSPAPAPVLPLGPVTREEAKKWLVCRTPRPEARYRMICLAWAGGNSGIYRTWELPNVEVVAVELPGRNARMREQALKNFNQIIDRIAQAMQVQGYIKTTMTAAMQVQGYIKTTTTAATPQTKPLIIFGHSFGAILTVHLARTLIERGADVPHYVVVSGCSPLDVREGTPGISGMSSEEILDYLKNMGGIPPEVAANRELMEIFLPAIKGDYTAIDNYSYTEASPLPCPILALGGEQDDRAPPEGMAGWSRFTTKTEQFNYHIFPGGHFFIKNEGPAILALIGKHALSSSLEVLINISRIRWNASLSFPSATSSKSAARTRELSTMMIDFVLRHDCDRSWRWNMEVVMVADQVFAHSLLVTSSSKQMFWPPSSSGASSAAGGGDPAASVFDPNSFYNLGRCLQEQGQDEKDRYARGGNQLSESAPLPPTHRRDHGSDSLMLCSIRPQDVPPAGHRPFYDSMEDMNGPNEVRCRSMNDSMFMRQTRAGKMSGTLSPIISQSPPIPFYGAARRLDLSASPTGFSVSQIEGLVGGISSSSSAASGSSSFSAATTNLPPPGSPSSSSSFSVKNLVGPVWTPVKQIFGDIFSILTGSKGLEDHETPPSASSSCSSSSKLSKEWCFVLGLALGFCCVAVLFPRTPVVGCHGGGGAYMPHYHPAGTDMYYQLGGGGGLIGWLASFGSSGSNGHSGLLNSPSSSAAATPTAPSPGLGLSNNRKSQYMMSKPVLSSPTPAPGPSNKNGEPVPTSTGGFTAMLEAFLGTWTKTDTSEGIDSMVSKNRTETFRLPSGRELVITLVKVSTGIWQVVTHALCGVLLALLRHLPFMPKNLKKSKQWC